jgi:hypothetical protein
LRTSSILAPEISSFVAQDQKPLQDFVMVSIRFLSFR